MKQHAVRNPVSSYDNKGATITKNKHNNPFLRYVLSFFFVVIVFLPPIYLHLHYFVAKESEFGQQPTKDRYFEPFKNTSQTARISNLVGVKKENDISISNNNLVLTAYLEPPETIIQIETDDSGHILIRNTSASILRSVTFPNTNNCLTLMQDFPIDNFPLEDPYLPWIHDYFPSLDAKYIQFVAQNKRKCNTGVDHHVKFWLPQLSLYQKIPIVEEITVQPTRFGSATSETTKYRLASSFKEATHNATRFQCRFHHGKITITTLSVFPFDYEFITWRKGKRSMFNTNGQDRDLFWLSQLLFACPLPKEFQSLLSLSSETSISTTTDSNKAHYEQPALYVDLIPIRTPARNNYILTREQTGMKSFETNEQKNLTKVFGSRYIIPPMNDAGRWQNLPICRRRRQQLRDQKLPKK